jgi:hypothetical protein
MTIRDFGEAGIKLIGVYFGVSTIAGIVSVVVAVRIAVAQPGIEGFAGPNQLALLNAGPILGELLVAAICLFAGSALAERFFDDRPAAMSISQQDLLMVGLVLIGVSKVVAGLPAILRFAGQALWYAQGSQQSSFLPAMERSWTALVNNMLEVVVGGLLVAKSRWLASKLGRG